MVIVAAVDRSDRRASVIEEAEALAKAFDDDIHVVHVLTRAEFVNLGRTSAEQDDPINMDRVRKVASDIAADAAGDLDVPFEPVGLVGEPASRITDYAEKQDARYIVVSGRNRSPTGKALFGSVTQTVLLNADRSVVTAITE